MLLLCKVTYSRASAFGGVLVCEVSPGIPGQYPHPNLFENFSSFCRTLRYVKFNVWKVR